MKKLNTRQDFYFKKAKLEGNRARSYYKLKEIDEKFSLFSKLKKDDWVLDIGCSPGSWSQYGFKKTNGKIKILGIDINETEPFPQYLDRFTFLKDDFQKISENTLYKITQNKKFSLIISDLAPKTSGMADRDAYLSFELVLSAWEFSKKIIKNQGIFIAKYFQGEESQELFTYFKKQGKSLKLFKPQSSRKNSVEIYLIIR